MPPKRNLRVAKWIGRIPAQGVCTLCGRNFNVPMTAMARVSDAQESLRMQFAQHKCKHEAAGLRLEYKSKSRESREQN